MALAVFYILFLVFGASNAVFFPLIRGQNIMLRVLGSLGTLFGVAAIFYMVWHQKAVYNALLTLPGLGG